LLKASSKRTRTLITLYIFLVSSSKFFIFPLAPFPKSHMTRKTFLISMLGLIVQYYDHHLFGFLAPILAQHFMAASDPIVKLLDTYFILAIGYLAKPIGALVLGRIGDLYGRSVTLTISLAGASIGSLIISLIPGYSHIGALSALILLIARMSTCAVVSSGTDGVRLFIYERIGKDKQCLGTGLAASSTLIGSFIASMSALFFTLNIFPSYSWRFAFLLGSAMGVITIMIRRRYVIDKDESSELDPSYEEFKNEPTLSIILKNWKLFILCLLVAGAIGSTNQFYIIFFGTYNFEILHTISRSVMQFYISIGIALYIIFAVIGGLTSDMLGRKFVGSLAFVVLLIITIATMFFLSRNESSPILFFASLVTLPFFVIPALASVKQSIPKVIRYRMFSFAHAIGSICISAPTALFSTLLYHETKVSWAPMCYFLATILIIVISTNILYKKYGADKY